MLQPPLIKLFLIVTRCDLISQVIIHNCINLAQRKCMLSIHIEQRFMNPFVAIINDQECKLLQIYTKNTL